MEYKACTKCKEEKPYSEFPVKKTMKLGLDSWCKTCKNKDRSRYKRWPGYKENNLAYYYKNKEKWRGIKARRRAREKQAFPSWAGTEWEEFAVKEIYLLCNLRSKITGVKHEVDHIVPLTNNYVCGLHTANNLQILTQEENRKKSNNF